MRGLSTSLGAGLFLGAFLVAATDSLAVAFGQGAEAVRLASGFLLLALGRGALHRGGGRLPLRAAPLWFGVVGLAPLLAAFAPMTAIVAAALLYLPLRALGARLGGRLAARALESPAAAAREVGVLLFAAALGAAVVLHAGLGQLGFLVVWLGLLLTTSQRALADPPREALRMPKAPTTVRLAVGLLAAAAVLLALFLAPAATSFDLGTARDDAVRFALVAGLFLVGWATLGAPLAELRRGPLALVLLAAAFGAAAPRVAAQLQHLSDPETFHALVSGARFRSLLGVADPRVPPQHWGFVPLVTLPFAALPAVLAGALLRATMRPADGPGHLGPALLGAGAAAAVAGAVGGPLPWGGTVAAALAFAAAFLLLPATLPPGGARAGLGGAVLLAAAAFLRPVPQPEPHLPMEGVLEWRVAEVDGEPLQENGASGVARIVVRGVGAPDDPRYLALGRTFLTPPLDQGGPWTQEAVLFSSLAPAGGAMVVGGLHADGLERLTDTGRDPLALAADPALGHVLVRHLAASTTRPLPDRAELFLGATPTRLGGKWPLVLMRTEAPWAVDARLFRTETAVEVRSRLQPGGLAVLSLDAGRLVPGLFPDLVASWRRVFPRLDVFLVPDGLTSVRLALVGSDGALPPEPQPGSEAALASVGLPLGPGDLELLRLPPAAVDALAAAGRTGDLLGPMPRFRARLGDTAWRIADGFRTQERRAAALGELAALVPDDAGGGATLLRAVAAQAAAQRYSSHDDLLVFSPDAVEVSAEALATMLELARAHPDSALLRAWWGRAATLLRLKREVELVETYLAALHDELGWREPRVTLALANAALEMLDPEAAAGLVAEVLAEHPADPTAVELRRRIEDEAGPIFPDPHAGHDHR